MVEVFVSLTSFEVDEADRKCIEVQNFSAFYMCSLFEYVFVCMHMGVWSERLVVYSNG